MKYVDNENLFVSSLTRYYVISPCSEYWEKNVNYKKCR